MRTSAARETRETATTTVHGSVRLRNGSDARLSLAITCSFAFRRDCRSGRRRSGDFTDVRRITRAARGTQPPRACTYTRRGRRGCRKAKGLSSARLAGGGAAVFEFGRRDAVGDDAVAPHVLGSVEGRVDELNKLDRVARIIWLRGDAVDDGEPQSLPRFCGRPAGHRRERPRLE